MSTLDDYVRENDLARREKALASAVRFNSSISEYFHPKTFREILLARRFFSPQ